MNIVELVNSNAANHPDKMALCDMDTQFTFRQIKEKSEQAAACFQNLGLKKGDPVAIMGQNSFDFVFSFFGCLMAGGIVVPVNHKLTPPEVDYILEDSKAGFFIFDGSLEPVTAGLKNDIKKISMDTKVKGYDFIGDAMAREPKFNPISIQDEDLAEILYTSGTTGNPKGCVHTHKSVVSAGITGAKAIDLTQNDRMLIAMPIWHSSPLNNWFMGITTVAGTSVLIREY
ncbi:MAG: long-chain fatty acid--CoA ligase, partial [Desulfobacula sp.]|nr:long-chain fatty acid--CoA ligase [Desulfobacula sp.]